MASTTLKHIWEDEHLWSTVVFGDSLAFFSLCVFAVYEGLEDVVMEWARVEASARYLARTNETYAPEVWRGSIVRSMVTAANVCSTDNSADRALSMFFKVVQWRVAGRQQRPSGTAARISLFAAAVELMNALSSGRYHNTGPQLYSTFQGLCNKSHIRPRSDFNGSWELSIARLALYHPTNPDPDPTIELMRDLLARHGSGFDPVPHMRDPYKRSLQRCHELLRSQKREQDSEWITQVDKDVFGSSLDISTNVSSNGGPHRV
ncbi:hypothetical protein CLAFUW4_12696 [Fulvia fulva]|uniref:Uncharacterized protein n=1 Tax=Passalora fulva TaxID=5499 RepID=A0A9Q8PJK2_PASFU|nr:uncharacterized protein CLAFUR5_12561 [Fulvia fulva]KAK4611814.1 hypothetical protein CLAFUR4_12701 [Fulvia fulva]KAK4612739.1 hypothetical protein CLAFUR0_12707 [Fulvia fulva]UJO23600.1 hypothetical protein CLAFUR5_12561 [Fulvia fulva]WPV21156.1 hypothetical protein CLAFUW4_12696 [Fulvia fulva]WPV36109.1 hypothetical protein CLAFUW7_12703 [Fulvia fulva]